MVIVGGICTTGTNSLASTERPDDGDVVMSTNMCAFYGEENEDGVIAKRRLKRIRESSSVKSFSLSPLFFYDRNESDACERYSMDCTIK